MLAAMRDRFRGATGDTGYLDAVTRAGSRLARHRLSQTLAEWLKQTGKLPQASRVVAVSHYPVPNIKHVPQPAGERETSLIGES